MNVFISFEYRGKNYFLQLNGCESLREAEFAAIKVLKPVVGTKATAGILGVSIRTVQLKWKEGRAAGAGAFSQLQAIPVGFALDLKP